MTWEIAPTRIKENLIKFFNREAVVTQSPGLPRLAATLGKDGRRSSNLEEVASDSFTRVYLSSPRFGATPLGLDRLSILSQGSRQSAATLGSAAQPLRG